MQSSVDKWWQSNSRNVSSFIATKYFYILTMESVVHLCKKNWFWKKIPVNHLKFYDFTYYKPRHFDPPLYLFSSNSKYLRNLLIVWVYNKINLKRQYLWHSKFIIQFSEEVSECYIFTSKDRKIRRPNIFRDLIVFEKNNGTLYIRYENKHEQFIRYYVPMWPLATMYQKKKDERLVFDPYIHEKPWSSGLRTAGKPFWNCWHGVGVVV